MVLKTPTYTFAQRLQLCAFLKESVHYGLGVGIAGTFKTQEVYKNSPFGRRIFKTNCHNYIKTGCLYAFRNETKQKNKNLEEFEILRYDTLFKANKREKGMKQHKREPPHT